MEASKGMGLGPMDNGPEGVEENFPDSRGRVPCVEQPRSVRCLGPRGKVWVTRI